MILVKDLPSSPWCKNENGSKINITLLQDKSRGEYPNEVNPYYYSHATHIKTQIERTAYW
jgi:hypothetical protein